MEIHNTVNVSKVYLVFLSLCCACFIREILMINWQLLEIEKRDVICVNFRTDSNLHHI